MGWPDGLRRASFRGVGFHVAGSEDTVGHRNVLHEIPGRDDAISEGQGRKASRFTIEGFLIGPAVIADRHRLQGALEASGPGRLVHPFYGSLDVVVSADARFVARSDRGRYFVVTMVFTRASALQTAAVDPLTAVDVASTNVLQQARQWMNRVWDIAHDSAAAARTAVNTIDEGLALVHDARRAANSLADIRRSIDNARSRLDELVYDVAGITQTLESVFTLGSDPDDRGETRLTQARADAELAGYRDLLDQMAVPSDDSTPAGEASILMNGQLVAAMSRVMLRSTFASSNEALEASGVLASRLQVLIDVTGDPLLGATLVDLQEALVSGMRSRAAKLASLTSLTLQQPSSSLVLAWDLYQDLDKEADIVARNRPAHPGMIPAGTVLEVVGQG